MISCPDSTILQPLGRLHVFINEVLFDHNCVHSCTYSLWLLLCYDDNKWSNCARIQNSPHSLPCLKCLLFKMFVDSAIYYWWLHICSDVHTYIPYILNSPTKRTIWPLPWPEPFNVVCEKWMWSVLESCKDHVRKCQVIGSWTNAWALAMVVSTLTV